MKIISPQNKIIVRLKNKFYDQVTAPGGMVFYQDTGFHPEEFVMMEAEVISVPRSIIDRSDYEGITELPNVGDTILIRYDVVFAYNDQPDRDTPIYKNIILINNEEYWRVDVLQAFAVKTDMGYRMLNGYVMCDWVPQEKPLVKNLIIPEHFKMDTSKIRMRIRHIQHKYFMRGDILICAPNAAQQYKIKDDTFYIIKQSHILGMAM